MRYIVSFALLFFSPLPAHAASIVLRALGGQAAPYGSMTLFEAGPDDHTQGISIQGCPVTIDGIHYITTCEVTRETLVNRFGGAPEGRRLVVGTPEVSGFGNCTVLLSGWNVCAGQGNAITDGWECPFTVPALDTTDFEVTATFEPNPGAFSAETCTRQVVDPSPTTSTVPTPSTTSSTVVTSPLEAFMDRLTASVLDGIQADLRQALLNVGQAQLGRLNYAAAGGIPGTLNVSVTTSTAGRSARAAGGPVVIAKGKKRVPRSETFTVGLKVTPAGRRLVKRGEGFTATLRLSFKGRAGKTSRSETFTVP